MLALMERFRLAYANADRSELQATVSDDFEWHQHRAAQSNELPTGRVLRGVDALLEELEWRRQNWREVRYTDLQERVAGDLLVQTFTIEGSEQGTPFHARAVDLYPVQDGRIVRKDTYWKYLA